MIEIRETKLTGNSFQYETSKSRVCATLSAMASCRVEDKVKFKTSESKKCYLGFFVRVKSRTIPRMVVLLCIIWALFFAVLGLLSLLETRCFNGKLFVMISSRF